MDYKISDIKKNGFMHSKIYECYYTESKKIFKLNFGFADLQMGGALIDCTITITDWWDLDVTEKGSKVNHKYPLDSVPTDIEQIIRYSFDDGVLTLKACGYLDIDTNIYYKFVKPKIQITGEYDPD